MGKKGDDGDTDVASMVLLGMAAVALVVLVAPALVLSAAMWMLVKDRLGRREYAVLAAAGLAAWVVAARVAVMSYVPWVWAALTGQVRWGQFPWFTLAASTVLLLGVMGLLSGTRLTKRLPSRFLAQAPVTERSTILPTEDELEKVTSVVSAPGAPADPVVEGDLVGTRRFRVAVGASAEPVWLSEAEVKTHVMLLGATGSGKTETIKVVAGALLDLGWSGLVLDQKEDSLGLRAWCEEHAATHRMPYQELCSSAPESATWFNPLAGLGVDEIRDTVLALQEFDDQHWANINKEVLGQLVNLMVWAHQVDPSKFKAPTMYDMGRKLRDLPTMTKLERAAVRNLPGVTSDMFAVLAAPPPDTAKSAPGFGAKLTQIFDTQAGRTVLSPGEAGQRRALDVTSPGLTYIGLDTLAKPDLSAMVSAAVLQRMSAFAAARTTGAVPASSAKHPRFLIVDEAGWVNRRIVTNLLARARSAGIAVMLCTQGPLDWVDKESDDWGMMTNNVNVALVMKQGSPESAQLCADYIGQHLRRFTSETVRTARGLLWDKPVRDAAGDVQESRTVKEEMAYMVEPEDLRKMRVGEVIVRVGTPTTRTQWGRVRQRGAADGTGVWVPAELP